MNKLGKKIKEQKSFKLCLRKKKQAQIKMLMKLPHLQCKHVNIYKVSLKETFTFPILI